jgi:hypothetical protein
LEEDLYFFGKNWKNFNQFTYIYVHNIYFWNVSFGVVFFMDKQEAFMFLVFNISNLEIPIDNFNKPKLEI